MPFTVRPNVNPLVRCHSCERAKAVVAVYRQSFNVRYPPDAYCAACAVQLTDQLVNFLEIVSDLAQRTGQAEADDPLALPPIEGLCTTCGQRVCDDPARCEEPLRPRGDGPPPHAGRPPSYAIQVTCPYCAGPVTSSSDATKQLCRHCDCWFGIAKLATGEYRSDAQDE